MPQLFAQAARAAARGFAGHPPGLVPLFFTELWERFSYYGMRALLVIFLTTPAVQGGFGFSPAEAGRIYGTYTMAVYLLSIPGGFLADRLLGPYTAVLWGGAIIAAGHFCLAAGSLPFFYLGLFLIVLGTGLFKPNISALVGGLYSSGDPRRDAGFAIFYMGINIGGFVAPLVTGFLAQSAAFKILLASWGFDPRASWHWGFGAAGVGMVLGLLAFLAFHSPAFHSPAMRSQERSKGPDEATHANLPFWHPFALILGGTLFLFAFATLSDLPGYTFLRSLYLLVPAAGAAVLALRGGAEAMRAVAILVFVMAAMIFFALFEQAGSSVALFADRLTRTEFLGQTFPSAWFQSLNPLFVILLTPVFATLWMRLAPGVPSLPFKFALGLFFLGLSFLLMVPAAVLAALGKVSPLWIVGLFFLQTVGELFLSPVGLSAMTKLAPERLTGFILGIWFLAMAFGNKLAGVFGAEFQSEDPARLASFFGHQGMAAIAAALVLVAAAPWLKRLMGGVR